MPAQMHSLLKRQIARASCDDAGATLSTLVDLVNTVYVDWDRDRLRTDRSMTLMIEELSEARALIEATFENIQQGVMMIDASGNVRLFNRQVCHMLSLPHEVLAARPAYASLDIPAGVELESGHAREIVTGDGRRLEVLQSSLRAGGFVQTYVDVTQRRRREREIQQAQAEFRALFENAVVGIYRCDLNGRPQRVNPALARLHGFDDPEEFFRELARRGVEHAHHNSAQFADFIRDVRAEGLVADFTWEIQRLKSGEPIWVTETAWTVAGPDGSPAYIEGTVIDATEQRLALKRVTYLAHHDPLTGLANREVFNKELAQRLDPRCDGRPIALHCIDLDRFKMVNDTMGHTCGDRLLQVVASRLRTVTHGRGLAARLGGDEFAFIQTGSVGKKGALELAGKIQKVLNEPYEIDGKFVAAGATIGVALFPDHATNGGDLFNNADLALCDGKTKARGSITMFDPVVAQEVLARRLLETELRMAWAQRQFHLVFQPIFDIGKAKPRSYEALLRWDRGRRPPVSPAEFIPLAEEIGLISEMGAFVLLEACRKVSEFDEHTSIAVNASALQFRDRSIVKAVREALAQTGLSANRLIVEVTETLLMLNDETTSECIAALNEMGVRLALDDFGIGYSALSYLANFNFNAVKIDRTFIARMEESPVNKAIVQAILEISNSIGMVVVAEGVETREQADRLQAMGCVNFQGYLFGKPTEHLQTERLAPQALCA